MSEASHREGISRRSFLKGLGALALLALPACRRAQQYAVQPEDCPEWMLPGNSTCFATCMPWATGAIPLLAVCYDGLPVSLQSNPAYEAVRRGLPAFAQASILDLYDENRLAQPTRAGKPHPMQAFKASLRAWAALLKEGRRVGFLFPAGYSAIRMAQVEALRQFNGASFYSYDVAAGARPGGFPELEMLIQSSFGPAVCFDTGFGSLADLTQALPQLEVLFIFTPADPAAFDADFAAALQNCTAETVRLMASPSHADVTSGLSLYVVPQTHYLEEWGADADAYGNLCLRQPITQPLRAALSEAEVLHALLHQGEVPAAGGVSTAKGWLEKLVPDWETALKLGYVPAGAPKPREISPTPHADINFYLHPYYADGRFRHNAWLRENYFPLSGWAGDGEAFLPGGGSPGSLIMGSLRVSAWRHAGLKSYWLPLYPEYVKASVGMQKEEFIAGAPHAESPHRAAKPLPMRRVAVPRFSGKTSPQWGMVIDLSRCIGCGACTLACRAENNIPTVGLQEMCYDRDLQWLRIERYLSADGELHFVPMACRQCEKAPCEAVCPVNATTHTSSGLNTMVYPRCWGTRYCSAACPYQARTFNFRDYAKAEQEKMSRPHNPQVTLRSRGVMEKCTYCVQRINAAENAGGPPPQTACQQVCPTGAIKLINLCDAPLPEQVITSFDVKGTHPRTLYT